LPRTHSSLAPWWTPWGIAIRLPRVFRSTSDVVWFARIGWFIIRLPADLERSHLTEFLGRMRSDPRPAAQWAQPSVERVIRLRTPWLRLPWLRSRDTCYVRSLTLYRFLAAPGHDVQLRLAAEWFDQPGGVLRGHAWVTLDGVTLEAPAGVDDHARLQPIELMPREA
jgi:hypothetical protein